MISCLRASSLNRERITTCHLSPAEVAERRFALACAGAIADSRYFFNAHDGISITDTVGSKMPTSKARSEAVETIAERLRGTILTEADVSAWLMSVVDESGFTVKIIDRSDVTFAAMATG
jgi:hypothetical protein